jgi:tetratricopeptide (TPR) repeat protein
MENDKWVWADEEDLGSPALPLLEKKLTPIVEWPPAPPAPEDPPAAIPEETLRAVPPAPNGVAPAPVPPVPAPRRDIPPSVVKAIVLHLEGKLDEAIREIQAGLQNGEPAAELYSAMGALQMELDRFEDAAASFRQVLQRDPQNQTSAHNLALCVEKLNAPKKPPPPSPNLLKAIVLHMEKKIEEAIRELQRAVKSGEQPVDVYAALGHLQFEAGRFDSAAAAYSQVLQREPLHKSCHYNLAVCLEKLGRHKEALAAFQKAFEIDPQRIEIGIGVGVSLLHLRRFADALAAFETCLRAHPDDTAALFGKAFALESSARPAEAEAAYSQVLDREPAQEETLVNLIGIAAGQNKDAATREYCGRLLAVRPESKVALEALITLDLAAGNYEAACAAGEKLTRIAADSFEAWFNFGVACHGAKRADGAIAAFSKAARIRPKSFEALSSLGQALQAKGDLAAARSAWESALRISPDHPAALWNMVLVAEHSGAPRDAEKFCAQLAAKPPKSDAAPFRLGSLRLERGDYPAAADAFRLCLKTRPDSPEAQLNLGLALWKSGKHKEARQVLEAVVAAPYCLDALHHLATLALEREDYLGALGIYKRLAEAGERSSELFYNTGLILQNLGRQEEAAVQYREALAVQPDLAEAAQALSQISKTAARTEEIRKSSGKDPNPPARLLKSG